jgi:uroporphyrinogen-III synthase
MRVLLTRPRPDAEALAVRIRALGHTATIEPLIDIAYADGPDLDLQGVHALVFTSTNGARAAARRTRERTRLVLAVGPTTAAQAKNLGFTNVSESPGEGVDGLAHHIRSTVKPSDGTLLHATGTVTAGNLTQALSPQGFVVRMERVYEASAAKDLSGALTTELNAGLIDGAMFFSARTAVLFATLVRDANLAPTCAGIRGFALSRPVANALAPLAFRDIQIARAPAAEAMLELLQTA